MNNQNRLSTVTKDYLAQFHCILDEMTEDMTSATLNDFRKFYCPDDSSSSRCDCDVSQSSEVYD